MPPTHPSQAAAAAAYRTLIAHETEPKEQDFYRTRLQRLEQATEPVCEFDCRRRGAAAGVGVYCPQCSAKCADTDLTTKLAKAIRAAWVDRLDWDELAHAALKFLTAAGRLVPSGGMALTAEQVEDVRTVAWYTGAGLSRAPMAEIHRLRALFPATEPAEDLRVHNHTPYRGPGPDGHCAEHAENGRLRGQCMADTAPTVGRCPKELEGDIESFPCVLSAGHRERCKSAGGLTWGYFTPAEPTEEETTAERDSEGIIRINGGRIVALSCDTREMVQRWFDIAKPGSKWQRDYAAALDLFDREAASSPVVPAPTETGPWQTWQEVPEGVWFLTNQNIGCWMRRDGDKVTTVTGGWPVCTDSLAAQAPFVAAEEG